MPDGTSVVSNYKGQKIDTTYCVLDLETTGFSPKTEKITEVGIMKVKIGEVIDSFSCFVNPEKPIPARVVEVTNITDDMLKDNTLNNYVVIEDRKKAVNEAINKLNKNDILLILGKGHEEFIIIGNNKIPYNDRDPKYMQKPTTKDGKNFVEVK